MASLAKTSSRASRGLLLGLAIISFVHPSDLLFSQVNCDDPFIINGPVETLDLVPKVVVRAHVGLTRPVACLFVEQPGHYRILPTIAQSPGQLNESYFLTVCDEEGNCHGPCDPNAGDFKVVLDDSISKVDTLVNNAGIFFLESGANIIMLNHISVIADQFPELVRGDTLVGESVHMLRLLFEATTDTYDLAVTQSTNQDFVRPDSSYSYSLAIQNTGSATVHNIELTNTLPEFVTLESFEQIPADRITGKTLFWNFDSLPASQTINIGFSVKFSGIRPTAPIELINTSRITGTCDRTIPNNTASTTVIGLPPIRYDLELNKSVDKDSVQVLEDFNYLLRVVNRGPDPATDIILRDVMPAHVLANVFSMPPSVSTQDTFSWHFESLAVGDSIEVIVSAEITESIPTLPSFVTNRALVSAPLEMNPDNNSAAATVKAIPPRYDLELHKTASRDSVQVGRGFSYNLVVVNRGPDPAKDIVLRDIFPDFLEIIDTNIQPTVISNDTILWQFDSLAVFDTIQVHLNAKITDNIPNLPTPITNVAEVTAPEDFNTLNSMATSLVTVIPMRYDLAAQATASTTTVRPGTSLNYFLNVSNQGPDTAEDVLVKNPVPDRITFANFSQSPTEISADTVFWRVDSIRAGATFNLTIDAQVDEFNLTDPVDISNSVSVTAKDDSNPANNTATAIVTVLPPDDCLHLDQNVFTPNSGNLQINFQLSSSRNARLDLYDVTGYHLATLADKNFDAGTNTFLWDGVNSNGKKIGSGVYILTLRSGGLVCWVKVIVVQ